MATAIITPDQDTIISEIDIAAPPDRVFDAIANPETVRRRSPQLDIYEMDLRVGGKWRLEMACQSRITASASSDTTERFLR